MANLTITTPSDREVIGQLGVYKEIVKNERIVNTESWEDWDAGETLVTNLTEYEGKTTFQCTILFPSKEVRDTVVKAGMGDGAEQSYNKLAKVLGSVS